jgi:thiamine-monophosphate kinase
MELSEDELIAAIRRVLSGPGPGVVLGMGDDAAVVDRGSGSLVLTTDMLVEAVHFDRALVPARDLGAKAIVVNVSDIAAMAASPRYALVSLAVPEDVGAKWVVELAGGMRDACEEYALTLVGGDTNRADEVVISVTVVGEVAPGHHITRGGAHPGDLIVVTGTLGAAAAGYLLSAMPPSRAARGLSGPWGRDALDALLHPVARVGEGQTLAQAGATAMMDLSDGLAKDLSRLCAESGVGARVEAARVPVSPAVREGASFLGADPLELAVGGGEDYELLATMDATDLDRARAELDERFGVSLTEVGVISESGLTLVGADGIEGPLAPKGWDHFRRAT